MATRLLTIDFWNTLVSAKSNGALRERARIDGLLEHGKKARKSITELEVRDALKNVAAEFDRIWLGTARTMRTAELVDALEQRLRLIFTDRNAVIHLLQESVMAGPPEWAAGAVEAVKALHRSYRLAVISDTMFSPGSVLRRHFANAGILDCFEVFVFSDEMGWSKPDRRSFLHALESTGVSAAEAIHIGDMQATDIFGAQRTGMRAILFAGLNSTDRDTTTADATLMHWKDAGHVLESLS